MYDLDESETSQRDEYRGLVHLPESPVAHSRAKRCIDMVLGSTLLLGLSPLLLLLALLIRLESPGHALFRQERTGLGGQRFIVYKLRTMSDAPAARSDAPAQPGDARVTRLGRILRRTSLDELPQLLNIIRGEMSLIGPRPHAVSHDDFYRARIEGYNDRFRARPGLTGLAQVRNLRGGGDLEAIAQRVKADNEYIETWSIGADARILLATIPHLIRSEAY